MTPWRRPPSPGGSASLNAPTLLRASGEPCRNARGKNGRPRHGPVTLAFGQSGKGVVVFTTNETTSRSWSFWRHDLAPKKTVLMALRRFGIGSRLRRLADHRRVLVAKSPCAHRQRERLSSAGAARPGVLDAPFGRSFQWRHRPRLTLRQGLSRSLQWERIQRVRGLSF